MKKSNSNLATACWATENLAGQTGLTEDKSLQSAGQSLI